MFLNTSMSLSTRTIRYPMKLVSSRSGHIGSTNHTLYSQRSNPLSLSQLSISIYRGIGEHLNFVQVSANLESWGERECRPLGGRRLETSLIHIRRLRRTDLASSGSDGVAITTSGYFELTARKELCKTSTPARYEVVVRRVT